MSAVFAAAQESRDRFRLISNIERESRWGVGFTSEAKACPRRKGAVDYPVSCESQAFEGNRASVSDRILARTKDRIGRLLRKRSLQGASGGGF